MSLIFYNKDLLKKLTGLDWKGNTPTYREFYNACKEIQKHKNAEGRDYIPIVGSMYHFNIWAALYDQLTYPNLFKADYSYDGFVGTDEMYVGLRTGNLSFHDTPAIRARFRMIRELADFCQTGFTGLTRDDGVFLFIQQRGVFVTSGTWDAGSLREQAKGNFEVELMDFPVPSKDDPEFGDVVCGPRYENPSTAFLFTVTRNSKHPEVALDFIQFLTSKENNQKLNEIIGWIPSTKGTRPPSSLRNFEPNYNGTYPNFNMMLGGETYIRWEQLSSLFNVNQIPYDDVLNPDGSVKTPGFATEIMNCVNTRALKDYEEAQRDWRRGILNSERTVAGMRLNAMAKKNDPRLWESARGQAMVRLLMPEITHEVQWDRLKGKTDCAAPYEYKPEIREIVKQNLRANARKHESGK